MSSTRQLTIFRRGGARPGAGRKRIAPRPMVSHATRTSPRSGSPSLVTCRLVDGRPSLRESPGAEQLERALVASARQRDFALIEFSIQSNHFHLVCEARDAASLARAMHSLSLRVIHALHRLWRTRGVVFADRYHARSLDTPREVRTALVYVLHNARKHGLFVRGVDPRSSGRWFRGWSDHARSNEASPLPPARTWLLRRGWRKHGRISIHESPASTRSGSPRAGLDRRRASRSPCSGRDDE